MKTFEKLFDQARQRRRRIVLPESDDPRIMEAALAVSRQRLAGIILLTKRRLPPSSDPNGYIEVIDPETSVRKDDYIEKLLELNQRRGMLRAEAETRIRDPLAFAMVMVASGDADGCVAGAANRTSDVVRNALQIIGASPGTSLVSSFFIMQHDLPHQAVQGATLYADCALVIDPDPPQLAGIAIASADSAVSLLGLDPKVCLLSFSTSGSASHPHVDKVIQAGQIIREKRPDIALMSEVQFDAAVIPEILERKAPGVQVQAPANVFIFPDLQSANIGYKIAQRIGGVQAIGPVLQGLNRPVNDLSRGCGVDDIVQLVCVTAVQASAGYSAINHKRTP